MPEAIRLLKALGLRSHYSNVEANGYQRVLKSGEEALAAALPLGPSLQAALTDMRVPSGDGPWLLGARRSPKNPPQQPGCAS